MHDFGMHNIALTQPALRRGLHDPLEATSVAYDDS